MLILLQAIHNLENSDSSNIVFQIQIIRLFLVLETAITISPQLRNEREGMIKEDIVCSVMQLRIDNARKLNIQLTLVHTFKSCGIWIAKKMQITLGRQDTKGILDALYKWFYPSCYPFPIRTGRKELTRGTVVKCITSTFLHFLGFISFNIYLWLGWENYINVGILRSHAYFGSCWNLEEQR